MRYFATIITLIFLLGGGQLFAQDGYFVDVNYKLGRTSMTNLMGTFLPVQDGSTQPVFGYENGSWSQTNWQIYFGARNESVYWRGKVDGLVYAMADLIRSPAEEKSGPHKARIRSYEKLKESYPDLEEGAPSPWYQNTIHPISGAGDYKWYDFDFAVGGGLKLGINWAGGFLGAGGGSNGNVNRSQAMSYGVNTANLGYTQYGLKAWLFQDDGLPFQANFGIHRVSTMHKSVFTRRHGFGIDMEAKVFFREAYIGGYFEFKRFNGKSLTQYQSNMIAANRVAALGLIVGIQLSD